MVRRNAFKAFFIAMVSKLGRHRGLRMYWEYSTDRPIYIKRKII